MKYLSLLLVLASCTGVREGIAVGNPDKGVTVQLEPGDDVTSVEGAVHVREVHIVACEGATEVVPVDADTTALGQGPFPLPGERLCEVELVLDGPIELQGALTGGGRFSVTLDIPRIGVSSTVPFQADTPLLFLLGPGPWLTADTLDASPGASVTIAPGDPAHDMLASLVATQSVLCQDHDNDGRREANDKVVAYGSGYDDTGLPRVP